MKKLSVIVITLNEESNIEACLESVRWADEIIVLDSGSTDRTVELARKRTKHVKRVRWRGYGPTKNIGLDLARGEWILWLDADERVTPELAEEIRGLIRTDDRSVSGYAIARRAYFLGRWIRHCGWYPGRVTRLFRRTAGRFSENHVHEELVLQGKSGETAHDLLHFTDPNLRHYLEKSNRYTSLAAEDLRAAGRKGTVVDLLVRPPFMFFKMYVLRLGFLDGTQGFILCVLSSAYVFTKYAKLWETSRGNR